jgi:uncharacterized protein
MAIGTHSRRGLLKTCFATSEAGAGGATRVIDIHQHAKYSGRTDEQMLAHERAIGIEKTVLLPAGSKYGLAAGAGGNDTVLAIARAHPKQYYFFANELPDVRETKP